MEKLEKFKKMQKKNITKIKLRLKNPSFKKFLGKDVVKNLNDLINIFEGD